MNVDGDEVDTSKSLTGVSLFSGGGIGDLALQACGVDVIVAAELLPDRASVFRSNYPTTTMIEGDIRETRDQIIKAAESRLRGRTLDILFATPPCQGMSKNGRGKLLQGVRSGVKPKLDQRNRLALDAIEVALALRPQLVVFENVPEMQNALIEHEGQMRDLLELISEVLGSDYQGRWEVVEFADFGVPQRRQRLISVFSRKDLPRHQYPSREVLPHATHSQNTSMFNRPWVTVDEALAAVPPLDAKSLSAASHKDIPFHRVPILDEAKYFWVSNTPPGKGAFDNQCVNPACRFDKNPTHGSKHNSDGINRANRDTPLYCENCGDLLPRPWVKDGESYRLMSGFTSAYKRMRGDLPASALTRNLSYACSDQKLHPRENRVLSLHEAFILHTVDIYDFKWCRDDGKKLSDKTIREIIGESIPPKGLEAIFKHLIETHISQHSATKAA
ncbi:DNA cytosine methyltransferase [Thalassobacter stenotrophicus]|uniref:DNA cytosine methyltransferase n=1 Tax=Thalassobacter stenotrophicus TaxID=266809 RepID=UPI001F34A41C|nr:DNA cytosine methyltransferase [Thalassobacter stenotrophicus]